MKYYHKLYVSDALCLKWKEIQIKLNRGEFQFNRYLITLTKNEANHLEFFDSVLIQKKMVDSEDLFIIGFADGYHEAVKLVERITQDVLDATGSANIRGYLLEKQREFEERNEKV